MTTGKARMVVSMFVPHFLQHALLSSLPLFVPLWLGEFEVTRATLGTVMGTLYVFYGGIAIPVGLLADRYGSITWVALYLVGAAIAATGLGLSRSFLGLVVALLAIGVAGGLYHPPAFRLLSRQSYTSSSLFAYHNVGGNLGLGVGPLLTTVLLAFMDWRSTMLVAGAVFAVTGGLFLRYGPTNTTPEHSDTTGIRGRVAAVISVAFVFVLLLYLLRGTFYRGAVVFIPDYLEAVTTVDALDVFGRTIPPSRWVYSTMLLVGVGGQLLGGYLDDRVETTHLLAAVLVLVAVLLALIGQTTGPLLFAVVLLFGFSMMVLSPALQHFVAAHTPESERGLAYGFTTAGSWAAGGFIGASVAGYLATTTSYPRMFTTLAGIALLTVGVVLAYAWRGRPA
ncbi:MAG: MFS transporter [Halodesulfurarchaeum sp.]